ncbi:MAG: peptidoglycan-binding protein [Propionibacteriaceae bacterium]|nr:peptidoglycan-binding protein [Propionibacteriaceae bacterium]
MPTVNDTYNKARATIGVNGSTIRTWYNKNVANLGVSSWAWCAATIAYVMASVGDKSTVYRTAWVPTLMSRAKDAGLWHSGKSGIKSGDIVLFDFNVNNVPDHAGIVLAVTGTILTTMEGNASGSSMVRQMTRSSFVQGYVRPKYTSTPTSSAAAKYNLTRLLLTGSRGTDVKTLQSRLMALGYRLPRYGADSIFGNETRTAVINFQRAKKLTVDGIVGKNTAHALGWLYQGK